MFGTVEETQRLTPHLIRVVLGGPGLADFTPSPYADSYVSIALPIPGADYSMPCDLAATNDQPRQMRPYRRRYTIRSWDEDLRRLTIDFVVHAESGVAGPWAAAAKPGDILQFEGPSGGYEPDTSAAWHLMVGDESALPAIAVALERLQPGEVAHAFIEVESPLDHLELTTAADLRITWLYRHGQLSPARLGAAVRQLEFPPGRLHGFIHGEAAMVRDVRYYLLTERGIPREWLSATPYWRQGMNDEAWREVKKQWIAEADDHERSVLIA